MKKTENTHCNHRKISDEPPMCKRCGPVCGSCRVRLKEPTGLCASCEARSGKMSPEAFCYWLQGFVENESTPATLPTPVQWERIKDHLKAVFTKVTPNRTVIPDDIRKLEPLTAKQKKKILEDMKKMQAEQDRQLRQLRSNHNSYCPGHQLLC